MKAVVTGAAGFIGSHLVEALLELQDVRSVIAIDCFSEYYSRETKQRNTASYRDDPRILFLDGDLLSLDLATLVEGAGWVFHQAGQPGVRKSWGDDFATYSRLNIDATQRLLEACTSSAALRAFVYASSSSVYGDAERYPTTEQDLPRPRSPYGVTKLAAEHLCTLYAANFGLPVTSLRYFTVYGPRQRPDMAFTRFITTALAGEAIPLLGTGDQVREFTHVDDIVRANLLAAGASLSPGTVLNLSGGSTVVLSDAIELLAEIHGAPIAIERLEAVPGDVLRTGGATDRARSLLGWNPQVSIRDGLESQYLWAQQALGGPPRSSLNP